VISNGTQGLRYLPSRFPRASKGEMIASEPSITLYSALHIILNVSASLLGLGWIRCFFFFESAYSIRVVFFWTACLKMFHNVSLTLLFAQLMVLKSHSSWSKYKHTMQTSCMCPCCRLALDHQDLTQTCVYACMFGKILHFTALAACMYTIATSSCCCNGNIHQNL